MKNKLFKLLGLVILAACSLSAFGQNALFNQTASAIGASNYLNYSSTWELCTATQTVSQCVAAPDTASIDQAGNTAITFPLTLSNTGVLNFYATPGAHQILFASAAPGPGNYLVPIVIQPDSINAASLNDGYFAVSAPGTCFEAASANAGAGDGTVVISGSVPAVKGILSASGAGNLVFTCAIPLPSRVTSAKGAVIQDISFNYDVVTNSLDSWAATLKSYTGPASGASQTPASATLSAFGGSLTLSSFTGNGAVSAAGSYYTQKITLGTPAQVADRQVLVLQLTGAHAGATAITVTVPALLVHYSVPKL